MQATKNAESAIPDDNAAEGAAPEADDGQRDREAVERLTAALLGLDASTFRRLPTSPLARFRGRDVEEVAATLYRYANPQTLDQPSTLAADERVTCLAVELLRLYAAGKTPRTEI